jgi:hypothetical protein
VLLFNGVFLIVRYLAKGRDCGGNQSPMTKPFYHVIFSDDRDDDLECYLYVPEGKICISISI